MRRSLSSRAGSLTRRCVRWLVRRFYPTIEVTEGDRIPRAGPVLLCANHANSLVDPVLIGIASRRPVKFLAKAPLFKAPVLGPLMRALGMLPAHRGSDDMGGVRQNLESLDIAAEALAAGEAVGIFPEGRSHDAAQVEMVRSGVSRIAVQAAEKGARGVQVVPVGINYERKERFRSSVWVRVGEAINVDEWVQQHDGDARKATRALTGEIEQRLKAAVVHLDDPAWEPFLDDLEVLVPDRREAEEGRAGPVRQRKRLADAMNHFQSADRPRAAAVGGRMRAYRDAVHAAGLSVDAAILEQRGWNLGFTLVWQRLRSILISFPSMIGTLFHIVPFTLVRLIAGRVQAPGKTTAALSRLAVGVPGYVLWYIAAGWWMFSYFSTWFAATALALMPFLGLVALYFWRNAKQEALLWWQQLRFVYHPALLKELRAQQSALQQELAQLSAEYDAIRPRAPRPPAPPRWPKHRRNLVVAAGALAVAALLWFAGHRLLARPIVDPASGLDLAVMSRQELESQLAGDERSLRAILRGLDELEARATELQADFAAGRRRYENEQDDDDIRQVLLSYLNYRTALVRIVWRYQRHAEIEDEPLKLRCFLAGFTAASALYEASTKFVYQFNRSPETVARFNEGDPVWDIPSGLYDTIEGNLSNSANIGLMQSARQYYDASRDRMSAVGLGPDSEHAASHAAIARSAATIERLGGGTPDWTRETVLAARDLERLLGDLRYETQTAISTWIGDFKLREPRPGQALIQPAQLEQLRTVLQPGDILLERRNWYLSNAFLPGYWPHAALYVGTADDLQRLGLDQDPRVQAGWEEFCACDPEGHPHVIIEAMSEGVVFSSLEHSIGGADSAATLRPRLSDEQKREAIAAAFGHATKPYDFEFDFVSRDKLVCTEVVFRAYGANNGPIRFPVQKILGRKTMPAVELVRKVKEEEGTDRAELEFVAFIDGDEFTGSAQFRDDLPTFLSTLDRPAYTFLQGTGGQPKRRIGPLGWTLLALIGLFTAGSLSWQAYAGGLQRPPKPAGK